MLTATSFAICGLSATATTEVSVLTSVRTAFCTLISLVALRSGSRKLETRDTRSRPGLLPSIRSVICSDATTPASRRRRVVSVTRSVYTCGGAGGGGGSIGGAGGGGEGGEGGGQGGGGAEGKSGGGIGGEGMFGGKGGGIGGGVVYGGGGYGRCPRVWLSSRPNSCRSRVDTGASGGDVGIAGGRDGGFGLNGGKGGHMKGGFGGGGDGNGGIGGGSGQTGVTVTVLLHSRVRGQSA